MGTLRGWSSIIQGKTDKTRTSCQDVGSLSSYDNEACSWICGPTDLTLGVSGCNKKIYPGYQFVFNYPGSDIFFNYPGSNKENKNNSGSDKKIKMIQMGRK